VIGIPRRKILNIKNMFLHKSMIASLFGFDSKQHRLQTEILAGLTTFLTMVYVLAVIPSLFKPLATQGMDNPAIFTVTALTSALGTFIMALAKRPFAQAPGIGCASFFVFTVCLSLGYDWRFALTGVLVEGIIFILISLTGIRQKIVDAIPRVLRQAISVGIGFFIAFLGFKNAGIIVPSDATLICLGDITHGQALLAIIGIIIMEVLLMKNVTGGILISIIITTIIGIPMGITHIHDFFCTPPSIAPIAMHFDFSKLMSVDMIILVFTLLFMDLFDTLGTLVGVCENAGMVNKDGSIPKLETMLTADAVATTLGACLGSSTTTTFVESASGVGAGGRTGVTSLVVSICFLLSLFLSPFFLSIPSAATAPVLVIVGYMMMKTMVHIDLNDKFNAFPAFITIIIMPLTFSISNGILMGFISYVSIRVIYGKYREISPMMYVLAVIFILKFILL
jgi:AGZA family xanthine/uracil permease-like MFS transporter